MQPQNPEARLLVVDDEPNIRELLSTSLRYAGFEVTAAANGREALDAAEEFQPDLAVLDVMLPDMDGFTVTRRLRDRGEQYPILFLTARDETKDKVAGLTGIDQAVSRRLAGRFDIGEFRREFDRKNGKVTGRYDASVEGFDPYPDSSYFRFNDPSGDPLMAPLTSAAVDLTTRRLNWRPDGSYQLLSENVNKAWEFGHGINPTESVTQLRQMLALDPKLKLLIGHGLFDLATPYFASKIILDQLPAFAGPSRTKLVVYPGGHMFYSRDSSRQAFRKEVEALVK